MTTPTTNITQALIDTMTVADLRKAAAARGVKGASKMNKAALVPALQAFIETAKPATPAKASPKAKQGKATAKGTEAATAATTPATKATKVAPTALERAHGKADRFSKDVTESGWAATSAESGSDTVTVTATRGQEVITIQWVGPVFIYGPCTHQASADAKPVKLRNASQARQVAATPVKEKVTAGKK